MGLDVSCEHSLVWIGLSQQNWTHVQLWVCLQPTGDVRRKRRFYPGLKLRHGCAGTVPYCVPAPLATARDTAPALSRHVEVLPIDHGPRNFTAMVQSVKVGQTKQVSTSPTWYRAFRSFVESHGMERLLKMICEDYSFFPLLLFQCRQLNVNVDLAPWTCS